MHTDTKEGQVKARELNGGFLGKKWKRGRPRIRSAAYWRAYYALKQRQWRAAHPTNQERSKAKKGA